MPFDIAVDYRDNFSQRDFGRVFGRLAVIAALAGMLYIIKQEPLVVN